MTWHDTWTFQRSLLSSWVHISKRNSCWHPEQHSTERELRQFFMFQDKSSLVYCNNIAGLIKSMSLEYDSTEWRYFIDSSSGNLNAVLSHNWNSFSTIPNGHTVQMKETHNSMDHLLYAVNYQEHKWLVCGDLKVLGLVLGLQDTKYPCFLCLWDSWADDQDYVRQECQLRQGLKSGLHKVQSHSLV